MILFFSLSILCKLITFRVYSKNSVDFHPIELYGMVRFGISKKQFDDGILRQIFFVLRFMTNRIEQTKHTNGKIRKIFAESFHVFTMCDQSSST